MLTGYLVLELFQKTLEVLYEIVASEWIFNFFPLLSLWWQFDGHKGSLSFQPSSSHSLCRYHPSCSSACIEFAVHTDKSFKHRIAIHLRHAYYASYLSMKFEFLFISVRALSWDKFFIFRGLHAAMWHFLETRKNIPVSLEAVFEWLYPAILWLSGLTESPIAVIDFPENIVQEPSLFSVIWWIHEIELVHSG